MIMAADVSINLRCQMTGGKVIEEQRHVCANPDGLFFTDVLFQGGRFQDALSHVQLPRCEGIELALSRRKYM